MALRVRQPPKFAQTLSEVLSLGRHRYILKPFHCRPWSRVAPRWHESYWHPSHSETFLDTIFHRHYSWAPHPGWVNVVGVGRGSMEFLQKKVLLSGSLGWGWEQLDRHRWGVWRRETSLASFTEDRPLFYKIIKDESYQLEKLAIDQESEN